MSRSRIVVTSSSLAFACTPASKPSARAAPGVESQPAAPAPSTFAPTSADAVPAASPPPVSDALTSVAKECRATSNAPLDLSAALAAEACSVDLGDAGSIPPLAASVRVRVEPDALVVARGHSLVFHVVLENTGTTEADVVLERHFDWSGELGGSDFGSLGRIGHGNGTASKPKKGRPSAPPPPPPKQQATPGFAVGEAFDAKNEGTSMPRGSFGMVGLLGASPPPEAVRVVLPPSTRATATVIWAARGYDPNKRYTLDRAVPPPEPLAPGKYRLSLLLPVTLPDDARVTAAVTVTR